jgi:hypothetical protein
MTDRFTRGWDGERFKGNKIATVMWSDNHGEADVTITSLFDSLSDIEKLDALQDAIGLLQREYHAVLALYGAGFEGKLAAKNDEIQ